MSKLFWLQGYRQVKLQSFERLWDTVEPHLPWVNHAKPLG